MKPAFGAAQHSDVHAPADQEDAVRNTISTCKIGRLMTCGVRRKVVSQGRADNRFVAMQTCTAREADTKPQAKMSGALPEMSDGQVSVFAFGAVRRKSFAHRRTSASAVSRVVGQPFASAPRGSRKTDRPRFSSTAEARDVYKGIPEDACNVVRKYHGAFLNLRGALYPSLDRMSEHPDR